MSGGSTGERPFTDILTSIRYWIIHSKNSSFVTPFIKKKYFSYYVTIIQI